MARLPVTGQRGDGSDEPRASSAALGYALAALLRGTTELPPDELSTMVHVAGQALGARSARVLIADYGLTSLRELGAKGPIGVRQPIEGTLAGRAFTGREVIVTAGDPATVFAPLAEGSERLGVLELTHDAWSEDLVALLAPVVRVLVLVLISKRRYTDVILRSRRSEPLSEAAEQQWDLLPPLTCSTDRVSVSGILEPAYSIGGDSFDYALNPGAAEFAIVDAMGHGMPAVLLSVTAINGLRNARREGRGLAEAYDATGMAIAARFAGSGFVTGQLGRLDLSSGELTWLNAGHPLPLLVRDGSFVGELACRPSLPMGLGGAVREIATEALQPGDHVLFYTDGAVETRSAEGDSFGVDRLAELLVRATLEGTAPGEVVRRLSASVKAYNGAVLGDDATLLLVSYHGRPRTAAV
jgi:serine phosphatase RsbU (regulator of sigma subunit)